MTDSECVGLQAMCFGRPPSSLPVHRAHQLTALTSTSPMALALVALACNNYPMTDDHHWVEVLSRVKAQKSQAAWNTLQQQQQLHHHHAPHQPPTTSGTSGTSGGSTALVSEAVAKALSFAVKSLTGDLHQYFLDFAVFPEGIWIPESVLLRFWAKRTFYDKRRGADTPPLAHHATNASANANANASASANASAANSGGAAAAAGASVFGLGEDEDDSVQAKLLPSSIPTASLASTASASFASSAAGGGGGGGGGGGSNALKSRAARVVELSATQMLCILHTLWSRNLLQRRVLQDNTVCYCLHEVVSGLVRARALAEGVECTSGWVWRGAALRSAALQAVVCVCVCC